MTATNKLASCASMSVPTPGQKRPIIIGTTGMVGKRCQTGILHWSRCAAEFRTPVNFADRRDLKRRPK